MARWWRSQLPAGADTAIHLLRAVQLDWAVRHGYLYPRWAPDMVFGFGYPLFNVQGPAAQYAIAAFHALGLNFIQATLSTFALADLIGAVGAFILVRALFSSEWAALVSAIAFAYAPYTLGSLYRGSPAEALALGLLPWLLWSFYRLHNLPNPHRLALAGGLFALFPLLHDPSAELAAVTVVVFIAALALNAWQPRMGLRRVLVNLRPMLAALLLGLVLSAFVWLPVVFETRYIQIERGYTPGVLNYHFNFLSLRELVSPPSSFDPLLIGWQAPRSLGWPQVMLALAGLWRGRRWPLLRQLGLGLAAAGVLGFGFLTLAPSVWIWDHVPGLSLIQFPARLLGPASLFLAVLGGAALGGGLPASGAGTAWLQTSFACLACAAIILFGFAWTFQHADPLIPPEPSVSDIQAFERRTGSIGTTTAGEYLPVWVKQVPPADSLVARYAAGAPINRLDAASLPANASVLEQSPGVVSQRVKVATPAPFEALFDAFYFPGWQARVDGQAAPVRVTEPYGLMAVPVSAGTHVIELVLGTTPVRRVGALLAGAGLAVALGLTVWPLPNTTPAVAPLVARFGVGSLAVCGVLAALLLFEIGVLDRGETIYARTRFDGARVAGVQTPLVVSFADQMQLLGYDLSQPAAPSGGSLSATLYWRALQPLAADYSVSLALVDAEGHRYAQADTQNPAGLPTSRWSLDDYARDVHVLRLPEGMPPGAYHLMVTVYRYPELAALTAGQDIGAVNVTLPRGSAALRPPRVLDARFGPVTLLGAELGQAEAGAGNDVPLTLYWRTDAQPVEDYQARVSLLGPGEAAVQQVLAPVRADYGTRLWPAGARFFGLRSLHLPAATRGAVYTVTVGLEDAQGPLGAPAVIGALRVIEPARTYAVPVLDHAANARFGGLAELLGWDLRSGHLMLAWRALGTADRSYSLFVHVRDANGAILSQHDAPPANGARFTTSWLPGEILIDQYDLQTPPANFSVAVGLYDPQTGVRLKLPDGADSLVLAP